MCGLLSATNPLFPETATRQRIQLGGYKSEDFEFFSRLTIFTLPTKPDLLRRMSGRMGWPEGYIVMVGDSLTHDLLPVETLGFPTFWINPSEDNPDRPHGSLSEVKSWLSEITARTPVELNNTPEVNLPSSDRHRPLW